MGVWKNRDAHPPPILDLIDLDIPSLGYTRFISSWLLRGDGENFLVDPGPACTIGTLLAALDARQVDRLDWILLTHIHLDHAGGVGDLIQRYPEATVVCHEKAVSHLVDPERLWRGSLKILGDVARVYGQMTPIPEENIAVLDAIPAAGGIRVIPTPGHAAHHQCFVLDDLLFCGELFGIFHQLENGVYLRPATPKIFVLEDFLASMDAVAPYMDRRRICFSHYGVSDDGADILTTARHQLKCWVDVISRHRHDPDMDRIMGALSEKDPVYARKTMLPEVLYQREMHFSVNSINGILHYLTEKKDRP